MCLFCFHDDVNDEGRLILLLFLESISDGVLLSVRLLQESARLKRSLELKLSLKLHELEREKSPVDSESLLTTDHSFLLRADAVTMPEFDEEQSSRSFSPSVRSTSGMSMLIGSTGNKL